MATCECTGLLVERVEKQGGQWPGPTLPAWPAQLGNQSGRHKPGFPGALEGILV